VILVRDGADCAIAPAVFVDLARVPLDDDLSASISVSARRSTADRSSHASEGVHHSGQGNTLLEISARSHL